MNNMNFSKNPFDGMNNKTTIAGDHVFKQGDGGRTNLEDIRENMKELKNPQMEKNQVVPTTPDNQAMIARDRMQALRNFGRK